MEEKHCDEVAPGLYVGSLRSLGQVAVLGITHVLSAVNFEVTSDLGGRPHLAVPLRDDEAESLLPHLPAAIAFIQEALQGGGRVLVHCQAGQSRSVALAVAYIMKSQHLGAEEALKRVQAVRPGAEPNEGYWSQLLLFQDMRCRLDEDHPVYRLWRLEQVGRRWEEDGCWADSDTFAAPPSDQELKALQVTGYRCRKCRLLLLTQQHVVPVEAAMGNRMFRNFWKLRAASGVEGPPPPRSGGPPPQQQQQQAEAGSSLFVEPLSWMAGAVVGQTQGKLYCVSCNSRLGSFNWSGISNERGAWVTPAFQLHLSKLDVLEPRGAAAAAGLAQIRQPVFGAAARQGGAAAGQGPAPAPAAAAATPPGGLQGAASSSDSTSAAADPPAAAAVPLFTHLVLDCDGVLVDSERASCEALRQAIAQVTGFDIPHSFPEDYYPVFGMDVRSCLEHYQQAFDRSSWGDVAELAPLVEKAKEGLYKKLTEAGIEAFPCARELIVQAQEMGLGVGIASSGAPEKIQHNLSSSGLLGLVDPQYVVSAAYVNRGKPAPDVYLEAMRRLQCPGAGSVLVVEDAINGLKAARAAGAFAVAVTTSLPAAALEPHADLVVTGLQEVVELLRRQAAAKQG